MREFRFLDETRKTNGLTPAEEERWYELAQSLGVDVGQPQPQGYYADDGNWYPYPAGYDPATGQYAAAAYPDYSQQQQPPAQGWYAPPQPQQGYYGPDGNWYPYPPGYDPATGQYYPGYAPQPSYPAPQQWPMQQGPAAQAWPAQPQAQPQYDAATGQWGYPQPSAPVGYPVQPQQAWAPSEPVAMPPAEPEAYAPAAAALLEPQLAEVAEPVAPLSAPASEPEPELSAELSSGPPLEATVAEDGPLEVSSDEVMEVADDEVSPIASAPSASSPSSTGEALMASMRNALSLEDDLEVNSSAETPAAAVVAEPSAWAREPAEASATELTDAPIAEAAEPAAFAPELPRPTELRVPEVSLGDFGSLEDEAPLTQNAPTPLETVAQVEAAPPPFKGSLSEEMPTGVGPLDAPNDQEDTMPKGFDTSGLLAAAAAAASTSTALDDVPTRVYPANAHKADSGVTAAPVNAAAVFDAFEKTPSEPFASPYLGTLTSTVAPVPFDADPLPTSENRIPDEGAPADNAEFSPAITPQAPPYPTTAGDALGGSEDDAPPTTIERMPFVPSLEDRPDARPLEALPLPLLAPPEAPARTMSALDALAIGPEVPLDEPELPLLDVVPLVPEPSPVSVPPPPSGSGFTDWSRVPIVESPAMQVMEAQSAQLDDQPIPEEQPMDLSGSSNERLELASATDFVTYGNASQQLDVDLNDSGDFQVDSASLAALATGVNEGTAPVEEEKMELVSASEFINAPALTSTGEQWAGSTVPSPAVEPEDDGEIVQGIVLEDEAAVPVPELSPPRQHAELSWQSSAPTRPSPPPMPFPKVVTAPSAVFAVPAPAPPAPPPPLAMPVSAFTPPPAPPAPLNTRVATPIAPPPPEPVPVPVSDPFDRSGLSLGGVEPVQILVRGEHRVILHTVEGQVKRGSIREANLGADTVVLEGPSIENLPRARVKAIFFMLAPGARAPAADGDKVRVTFKDGRQVAGYSRDQKDAALGFFVVPADNRTNTERIFIYRHAVQNVVIE